MFMLRAVLAFAAGMRNVKRAMRIVAVLLLDPELDASYQDCVQTPP